MPGYFLIIKYLSNKSVKKYFKFISLAFVFGFLVSSWFYFTLFFEYGSFTAFNMDPIKFSLQNQPLNFYNFFNKEASQVFSKPIRPNFSNQLIPILYSDLWGDYWGYFVFVSRDLALGRSQTVIGDYLARVNIISLIPTIIMLVGLYNFKKLNSKAGYYNCTLFSFFGYLWFLVTYLNSTVYGKSSYIIQLFHLIVIAL